MSNCWSFAWANPIIGKTPPGAPCRQICRWGPSCRGSTDWGPLTDSSKSAPTFPHRDGNSATVRYVGSEHSPELQSWLICSRKYCLGLGRVPRYVCHPPTLYNMNWWYNKVPHINQEKGLFLRGGPHYLCGKTEEDSVKSHQHLVIINIPYSINDIDKVVTKLPAELRAVSVVACIL